MPYRIPVTVVEGDVGSAQFHLPITFDGETADFQIDTGSTYTSVSYTERTGQYPVSGTKIRTSAANVSKVDEKIILKQFRFGTMTKTDFEVIRYRKNSNQINRIGLDAIMGPMLNFDFKNLTFSTTEDFSKSGTKYPLLTFSSGTFGFQVQIGDKQLNALWDTGAELSVIDRDFVSNYTDYFKFIQSIDAGTDATGHPIEFNLYECDSLVFGAEKVPGVIMSMNFEMIKDKIGPEIRMILGTNHMRNRNWFFDFEKRVWALD